MATDPTKKILGAAVRGDKVTVEQLVRSDPSLVATPDAATQRTALHGAANVGHAEIVRFLLDNGGDPNLQDKYGDTALTLACLSGHAGCVRILLQRGADRNITNDAGDTPLTLCRVEEVAREFDAAASNGGQPAAGGFGTQAQPTTPEPMRGLIPDFLLNPAPPAPPQQQSAPGRFGPAVVSPPGSNSQTPEALRGLVPDFLYQ